MSDAKPGSFSDGITEDLINDLANIEGLRVASRTAIFALKGKPFGVQEIGNQLNVKTLLEGSIRREGTAKGKPCGNSCFVGMEPRQRSTLVQNGSRLRLRSTRPDSWDQCPCEETTPRPDHPP